MAARYVKNHSNYLLRKKHQDTIDGRILEKDWVTIGGRERYYSRDKKKSYHGDNNFVFTVTNIPTYRKKHRYGKFIAEWQYDDVKDAKPIVNQVKRNNKSNDIRDFAYYGSASELVRSSIENIIANFPPYLTVAGGGMTLGDSTEFNEYGVSFSSSSYIVSNPLLLDFWHKNVQLDKYDDINHFLDSSWMNFVYTTDGTTYQEITTKPTISYVKEGTCSKNIEEIWKITIGSVTLRGINYYDRLVFLVDGYKDFNLMPKKRVIDEYFNNVDAFESCLLNRESKPYYSNTFMTPKRTDYGMIETYRNYTWPSVTFKYTYTNKLDEYGNELKESEYETVTVEFVAIDTESPKYTQFVMDLAKVGNILDETYSDNIWGKMVHEAIKNYDWSYSRYIDEDKTEDYIEGGNQIEQFLRIYGRGMDDLKREADGIKSTNNITYDGKDNITDAELSDKLDLKGWEVYSTIPILSADEGSYSEDSSLSGPALNDLELGVELGYKGYTTTHITPSMVDNEFMRRFNLVSNRIIATKGTIESIDMIMGMFGFSRWEGDYSLTEEYRTTTQKMLFEWDKDNHRYKQGDKYSYVYDTDEDYSDDEDALENKGDNRIELANHKKYDMIRYYDDDPYSGLPLKEIYARNNIMLVPYYDHHKVYDGEMYFQFKGGWGGTDENDYEYLETKNYLQVVSTCQSLLDMSNQVRDGEIVYVISMIDYCSIFESNNSKCCMPTSHYMKCRDSRGANTVSGWELVDENSNDYERAEYLDSILSENKGNNPHVGYGEYDLGDEYWAYMASPFKYAIDGKRLYDLTGENVIIKEWADTNREMFKISEPVTIIHGNTEDYTFEDKKEYKWNDDLMVKYRALNDYYKDDDKTGDKNERWEDETEENGYILNSKVLTFTLGDVAKSQYFREYFDNVIKKYLLQVIPSTTILKFEYPV